MKKQISISLRVSLLLLAAAITCAVAQGQTSDAPRAGDAAVKPQAADSVTAKQSDPAARAKDAQSSPSGTPSETKGETKSEAKTETASDTTTAGAAVSDSTGSADDSTSKSGEANSTTPAPLPQGSSDKWQFNLIPYLWLAGINGRVGVAGREAHVSADFGDVLNRLDFGFMGAFDARKNRFVLVSDLLYLKVSAENASDGILFSGVKTTQKVFLFEQDAGYRLVQGDRSSLDVLAGIRLWHLNTKLLFRPALLPETEAEGSKTWVDGIAGLRGRAFLSKSVFVLGRADVGGGGSDFTYQFLGGGGWEFKERFSLIVAYRYLNAKYDRDGFLFDVGIKGPALGFGIKF